jgi:KH domain-containing protein
MDIVSDDISKIVKSKNKLERILNVKIMVKGERFHGSKDSDIQVKSGEREISIEGKPEEEYIAGKVIDAISFGFSIAVALLIKEEDFLFEILDIKEYTHRKDFETIRARLIGKNGKTLKTLNILTECFFELKDNNVGIIGTPECIKNAQNAIILLIHGSKQSNVYSFLEKHHAKPILDLGLKEEKKSKKKRKE